MSKKVIVIGYEGRMAEVCRGLLRKRNIEFACYGPGVPEDLKVENFEGSAGVIDFSTPEAAPEIARLVEGASVPWVCGTTGWESDKQRAEILRAASQKAAVVADSNFSLGIELLCQASEILTKNLGHERFAITDIHHQHKKDAPSGTSLKLQDRILGINQAVTIDHKDYRMGNIPGEHRVSVAWGDEMIEFVHRSNSRETFADGAIKALKWAQDQKPGLYSMKDVFS